MDMQRITLKTLYMAYPVKIDGLKHVVKNPNDFFLAETYKAKADAHNFWEDLTGNIIFFYH